MRRFPPVGLTMGDVKLIAATCPSCGANLSIPDNLDKVHCMYCGTQILVQDIGTERKVECKVCDGYGKVEICKACDGTGQCTWSSRSPGVLINGIPVTSYNSHCDEGKCSACHGTGKRMLLCPCPACQGSGKCPRCLGTGKCPACRGIGTIPNPNGAEQCRVCNGTGTVDSDLTKRP
jgi:RecJ-like exonuclease/DNA-directed RNA polymerase subunit RPC12/RpoP